MKENLPSSEIIIIITATWLSKSRDLWKSYRRNRPKHQGPFLTPLSGCNKINALEQDLGMQMAETARESQLLKPGGNRDRER